MRNRVGVRGDDGEVFEEEFPLHESDHPVPAKPLMHEQERGGAAPVQPPTNKWPRSALEKTPERRHEPAEALERRVL